jgi:SAM-dependent methyltransferase
MRLRCDTVTHLRTPLIHGGDLFSEHVRGYAHHKPLQRIQILEAGCGRGEGLHLDAVDAGEPVDRTVTGVDSDEPSLRSHTHGRRDLDGWHLGDLRTVPMPPRSYDVVHVHHLIERIPHAELVLDRFVAALKPGGLLLIRFRDRGSAFGYVDRVLPRWLRGLLWADTEAPPEAVYEAIASRQGMQWYCVMRGLVIAEEYLSRDGASGFGRAGGLINGLCRAVSVLSRNQLSSAHSEVTLVIRKPENRFARLV